MKKVYCVPFGYDFIGTLHGFVTSQDSDLSQTAIVFAGKRPSLYLKKRLAETMGDPFFSPRFFSIEEFMDFIARKVYPDFSDIDYIDAVWLLYQSIQRLPSFTGHTFREKEFGDFFWWGRYLFQFIDQLDNEDIDNKRLHSLEQNAQLGYDIPESTNELLAHVNTLRDDFHRTLLEKKRFTRGFKRICAAHHMKKGILEDFQKIYFAGIFALSATERETIGNIWKYGTAEIILEGDPSEWPILNRLTTSLGAPVEFLQTGYPLSQELKIYAAIDTHSEVLTAYNILKENPSRKAAIVLPTSEALFPLLSFAVDRLDSPYNISLGHPLSRTSLCDLITSVFNAQGTREDNHYYPVRAYLTVMLHPFVKNLIMETDVRAIIDNLEKAFSEDIPGNPFAGKACITLEETEGILYKGLTDPDLKRIHSIFFKAFEEAHTICDYAEKLEELLEFVLRHTAVASYILSGEIFQRVFLALKDLKNTLCSKASLHHDRKEGQRMVCDFIIQHLKSIDIPFETKPVEDLEVIGVLESRNIAFDTMIMLDVNEGVMPQPKKINPLIPLGIYDILGIPSPEYNEEIYRYNFQRLVRSSRNAHLIYIDGEDRPRSRYIEQIIWEREQAAQTMNIMEVRKTLYKIAITSHSTTPVIEKTCKTMALLRPKIFSPSAIDDYILCPVSFYFRQILRFEKKKTIGDDIEATDRGRIIHDILNETLKDSVNREISKTSCDEIISALHRVCERRFTQREISGDYYLFRRLTGFKLESFLRKNIGGAKDPFFIKELEAHIEGTIDINGKRVKIRGVIDRVDYDPRSGEHLIIDYKTGSTKQYPPGILKHCSFHSIEDIHKKVNSFQLPLYLHLFGTRQNVAVAQMNAKLVLLRNNEEELFFPGLSIEEREDLFGHYMEGVRTVISDLFDEDRPFAPFDEEACDTCDFNGLCHIQ